VHLGSAHSRASACSAKRLGFLGVSAQPRKQGREISPPTPAAHRPNSASRSSLVGGEIAWEWPWAMMASIWGEGRWEAHRGGCSTVVGDRLEGYAGEVVGRRWLSRLVRMESNLELGRHYKWGRWGWRSTRVGGRRWPGHGGDGGLEWSGGSSTVTVGKVVIDFSSGPRVRG
jgi:hypothetical protein